MARSLSAIALAAAALLVLLCSAQAEARVITVGGKGRSPWRYNLHNWRPTTTARAGDVLLFKWRGFIPHDVVLMDSVEAYNSCDFGSAKKLTRITNSRTYRYKVPVSAKGTTLYFSCSVPAHCSPSNMKVAIPIQA
ncbi:hypothetical protein CLOM_g9377 [Closterium sp. NIES-68]|nr:hypothetical protein CLOM_g9377 [Closterium sp. NIES-68]GJP64082.1 hypothetical protein CLOP_g21112 [Closterium sp. NIES-67]GJP64630.1 hypothetical protein CLOP_g21606 [Closterium sp. NIES-67]